MGCAISPARSTCAWPTFVINKVETASFEQIERGVWELALQLNPDAVVIDAASPIFVEESATMRGKRVLVIKMARR